MAISGGSKVEKGDSAERLMNITLALFSSSNGLTKQELFLAVRDYRLAKEKGTSDAALEKKFERDKSDLRESGIRVETFILQSDGDDNQQTRYTINASEFSWPQGVTLTPNQLQLLSIAASVWRQASLSSEATAGLDRLRALGVASETADLIGFAPRIATHEPSFFTLSSAVAEKTRVKFGYRKPGQDKVEIRDVNPWLLRNISGQWLLVCWDNVAGDVRNFMLKRIIGRIDVTKDTFDVATDMQLQEAEESLDSHIKNQVATLKIKRDSLAWYHFEVSAPGQSEEAEISFHYMDLWLLADELRDYAGDYEIVSPVELLNAVKAGFEKVAAEHG